MKRTPGRRIRSCCRNSTGCAPRRRACSPNGTLPVSIFRPTFCSGKTITRSRRYWMAKRANSASGGPLSIGRNLDPSAAGCADQGADQRNRSATGISKATARVDQRRAQGYPAIVQRRQYHAHSCAPVGTLGSGSGGSGWRVHCDTRQVEGADRGIRATDHPDRERLSRPASPRICARCRPASPTSFRACRRRRTRSTVPTSPRQTRASWSVWSTFTIGGVIRPGGCIDRDRYDRD